VDHGVSPILDQVESCSFRVPDDFKYTNPRLICQAPLRSGGGVGVKWWGLGWSGRLVIWGWLFDLFMFYFSRNPAKKA